MQMKLHASRIFAQAAEQILYLHPFCILLVWVFPTGLVNTVCGTQEPGANSRYGKISTCSCALAPTPQVSLISLWGQGVAR